MPSVAAVYSAEEEQALLAKVILPRYERMLTAVHQMVASTFPELTPDEFRLDDEATRKLLAVAAARVVMIDEHTRTRLQRVLQQGQLKGYSDVQIANGVPEEGYLGVTGLYLNTWKSRAETIARTEVSTAQVEASLDRYKATGLVSEVELVEATDTDAQCAARNGKVVPLGSRPGLLHPNCRVALLPVVKEPVFAPTPSPEQAPAGPPPFPRDPIKGVERVKGLGGSTGAELVKDKKTGALFVRKMGASPEHLREEVGADLAYRALGVKVPDAKLYEVGGRPVKLARFIEGESYGGLTGAAREAARQKAKRGFGADVLLGNWDVAGLGFDNLLVDKDGEVWRIDNGGSLRFRAQAWNGSPMEAWTLRDRKTNAQTAEVFGDLTARELAEQFKAVKDAVFSAKGGRALKSALAPEVFATVEERAAALTGAQRAMLRLLDDRWKGEYVDGFAREWMRLRASGLPQDFPKQLKGRGVGLEDENGTLFDNLRGRWAGGTQVPSLVDRLADHMRANGGDPSVISGWMSSQAGSSWSARSLSTKGLLARQRDVPMDAYFWGNPRDPAAGLASGDAAYDAGLRLLGDKWLTTWQQQHAFTYSLLEAVDFPHKNAKAGTVTLVRTEAAGVMSLSGFSGVGARGKMQRGVAESTSLMKEVYIGGSTVVTSQEVPFHRVLGVYWQERAGQRGSSAFLGDGENEFVAMLEGLDVDWKKNR